MNSPYTKHLDSTLDHPSHSTQVTTVPTYAAPVHQQPQAPMVIHSGSHDGGGSGASKAAAALVAIILVVIACIAGFAIGKGAGPSWNELRRFEALSGREGEIRGRDAGWIQGRKQGRTELEFLAKYERLRTSATQFNQGYMQGRGIGRQMGQDMSQYKYANEMANFRARNSGGYGGYGGYSGGYNNNNNYRGRGYGRGYGGSGYGYGGSVGNAIASAQNIANATGQPVDVIID